MEHCLTCWVLLLVSKPRQKGTHLCPIFLPKNGFALHFRRFGWWCPKQLWRKCAQRCSAIWLPHCCFLSCGWSVPSCCVCVGVYRCACILCFAGLLYVWNGGLRLHQNFTTLFTLKFTISKEICHLEPTLGAILPNHVAVAVRDFNSSRLASLKYILLHSSTRLHLMCKSSFSYPKTGVHRNGFS